VSPGPLELGEDLTAFDIGSTVSGRRPQH